MLEREQRSGSLAGRPGSITPLYRRLPRGPHGLARETVAHNQRIRIQGGMIEADSRYGYNDTSVTKITALAGVSRRAFYEQFTSKEDCFLKTFDVIICHVADHIQCACRNATGQELRVALRTLVGELKSNPKALRLILLDGLTVGPCRVLSLAADALQDTLLETPDPIVRMIVGGLHRVVFGRLQDKRMESEETLYKHMLNWTLLLAAPQTRELHDAPGRSPPRSGPIRTLPTDRVRLEEAAINLALHESGGEFGADQIADGAGVSLDVFLDLFSNPRECFNAAIDNHNQDILETVADMSLISPAWSAAVCQAIRRLTSYLAANPAYTIILATTGLEGIRRIFNLTDEITILLTEGATHRDGKLTQELISGALAYTLQAEMLASRGHHLQSLEEYLSYSVLAPYLGANEAVQTIRTPGWAQMGL